MPKNAASYPVPLETDKVQFLQQMVQAHRLPDVGKAIRCLINYAREHPETHGDIFGVERCLDC